MSDRCTRCRKFVDGCVNLCSCPEPPSPMDKLCGEFEDRLKAERDELRAATKTQFQRLMDLRGDYKRLAAERDAWREAAEAWASHQGCCEIDIADSITVEAETKAKQLHARARKLSEGE